MKPQPKTIYITCTHYSAGPRFRRHCPPIKKALVDESYPGETGIAIYTGENIRIFPALRARIKSFQPIDVVFSGGSHDRITD